MQSQTQRTRALYLPGSFTPFLLVETRTAELMKEPAVCWRRSSMAFPPALVSHDGKTAWSAEYDAWGNVLHEHNPSGMEQLIRLPGQQYDEENGLYYNRYRYYDPAQGRYITQDPIGLRGA